MVGRAVTALAAAPAGQDVSSAGAGEPRAGRRTASPRRAWAPGYGDAGRGTPGLVGPGSPGKARVDYFFDAS
jgi:hypothetical protein